MISLITNVAMRRNSKRKLAQEVARPTFGWIMSKLPERQHLCRFECIPYLSTRIGHARSITISRSNKPSLICLLRGTSSLAFEQISSMNNIQCPMLFVLLTVTSRQKYDCRCRIMQQIFSFGLKRCLGTKDGYYKSVAEHKVSQIIYDLQDVNQVSLMCMLTCELQEALIGGSDSHVACRCAWPLLFALLVPNHLTTDLIINKSFIFIQRSILLIEIGTIQVMNEFRGKIIKIIIYLFSLNNKSLSWIQKIYLSRHYVIKMKIKQNKKKH